MSEQKRPQVAIPLPENKKKAVLWGCVFMMLSMAMYGLVFATLTSPILESIGALNYISLFTIFASFGVALMTPIGGKLGDIIGRRNIILIGGLVSVIAGAGIAFVRSLWPLMILRLIVSLAQGAYTASPYILVGLINEPKDVPKAMGLLATAIAVGSFGGSIVAGMLTDAGMLQAAILMPALPALIGLFLIWKNLPNFKAGSGAAIDKAGVLFLALTLGGFVLAFNFGPSMGWTHPMVMIGYVLFVGGLFALIKAEQKAVDPLISLRLFKNKAYVTILIVNFIYFFYNVAMNTYAPIGAMRVMGASTTAAGSLQLPRTIVTILLPAIAGAWVGRKGSNKWKAMALATGLTALPFAVMGMTTPSTPVLVYMGALGVAGVAESFRSVSFTPAAQAALDPKDLGVGTSLCNFVSTLASTMAATLYGVAYNMCTASDPANVANIQAGVNSVFRIVAIVNLVGLAIVFLRIRPQMEKEEK